MLKLIEIIEGIEDASIEAQLHAWQEAVDTGLIWQLQGWYQRTAHLLIEQGLIRPPLDPSSY